jgi:transposase
VRYGYNRDGEKLPQINMAMIFGQNSQLPAYYRRLPGNITDVATLNTTLASLNFLGASHMHFVLDRGFYSQANIDELFQGHHQFTTAIPAGRRWIEGIIDKHYDTVVSPINYHEIEGQRGLYALTVLHKWGEAGRRCYVHIYYNASRAGEEYEKFTRHLLEAKRKLETGELSETDKKRYLRYFIVKETPKRGRVVKFNEAEIQKYRKRYAGFFCILSNKIKTAMEALYVYRTKEVIENSFDDLKNQLDMKRLRVHDSNAMDSRMFLQFLALIFISRMRSTIRKDKDLKNFTVREVMELMETIVQIKYSGRYGQLYTEFGPKERNIMDAFGIPSPT